MGTIGERRVMGVGNNKKVSDAAIKITSSYYGVRTGSRFFGFNRKLNNNPDHDIIAIIKWRGIKNLLLKGDFGFSVANHLKTRYTINPYVKNIKRLFFDDGYIDLIFGDEVLLDVGMFIKKRYPLYRFCSKRTRNAIFNLIANYLKGYGDHALNGADYLYKVERDVISIPFGGYKEQGTIVSSTTQVFAWDSVAPVIDGSRLIDLSQDLCGIQYIAKIRKHYPVMFLRKDL